MMNETFIQKITENWKVKIFCILGAIIIYVICQIAFLETKFFAVPLHVKNDSNLTYSNEIPRFVRVSARGETSDIALLQEKDFDVFIDLSDYTEEGEYRVPLRLQLSENATIINTIEIETKPTVVNLHLEPKITALIPIKTNISGTVASGYEISSFDVVPNLVQITGGASLVEKTPFLDTSSVNVSGKSSDFTQKIEVLNRNKRIELTGNENFIATVKIKPIKTSKIIDSSVVFFNSLDGTLSVENPKIPYTINISGNKNDLDKFVLSPLSVQVDCSSITTSGTYELPLSVILPENIILDKIEPEKVKVSVIDFVPIVNEATEVEESKTENEIEENSLSE